MNDGTIGTWSYRAGSWFAVFGTNTTLLLPESERERVVGLWSLVDGGADFTQVLDGLLASGLSSLQGFVLVGADSGPTRILLRGDGVRASLTTAEETSELAGAGVTTWVERTVDDVTALAVTVDDESSGPDFPIDAGLVRVSRIDLPPAGRPVAPEVQAPTVLPPALDEAERVEEAEALDEVEGTDVADVAQPAADEPSPIMAEPGSYDALPPPPPPPLADTGPQSVLAPPPPGDALEEAPGDALEEAPGGALDETPDAPDFLQPWPEPGEPAPAPAETPDADDPITEQMPAVPPPPPMSPPMSTPSIGDVPLPPPPPPAQETGDSDHDGLTQAGVSTDEFSREQPGIPGQPMAPSVTRSVAKLVISNGETVEVDRVVLIGRAPEARRFTSTEQPMLITVPSPMHEISSTHVEVRPGSGADHGSAVVTDMGSTNGTVLVQPGLPPEDLKPGIAVQLIPGAIINLGDGLTIQVARP